MLRMYTGMFSDFVYVNEERIAAEASLDPRKVYDALIELRKEDVISFVPRRRVPFIHFATAREEKRYLTIGIDIYERRREVMERRVEAMIDYAYNSSDCRVARMLGYFGEEEAQPCGTCDVCRDRRRSADRNATEDTARRILDLVAASPEGLTPDDLLLRLGGRAAEAFSLIPFLRDEGHLILTEGRYTIAGK